MNNEKQMVFSKQNFNQALEAAKTQKHVTVIGKFLSTFLPPLEPVYSFVYRSPGVTKQQKVFFSLHLKDCHRLVVSFFFLK